MSPSLGRNLLPHWDFFFPAAAEAVRGYHCPGQTGREVCSRCTLSSEKFESIPALKNSLKEMRALCFSLCAQNTDAGNVKTLFQPCIGNSRQIKPATHNIAPTISACCCLAWISCCFSTAPLPLPHQPVCSPKVWSYTVGKGLRGHAAAPNKSLHPETCSQNSSARGCFPVLLPDALGEGPGDGPVGSPVQMLSDVGTPNPTLLCHKEQRGAESPCELCSLQQLWAHTSGFGCCYVLAA